MRLCKGKPKFSSLEKINSRLKEKFLPLNFAQAIFLQFNNPRQKSTSLLDYLEEFYKHMACTYV